MQRLTVGSREGTLRFHPPCIHPHPRFRSLPLQEQEHRCERYNFRPLSLVPIFVPCNNFLSSFLLLPCSLSFFMHGETVHKERTTDDGIYASMLLLILDRSYGEPAATGWTRRSCRGRPTCHVCHPASRKASSPQLNVIRESSKVALLSVMRSRTRTASFAFSTAS